MSSQYALWLYPLLTFGLISALFNLRIPLRWSWGMILKSIALCLISALGIWRGPDWLFALIGWSFALIVYLPPYLMQKGVKTGLLQLNAVAIRKSVKHVELFYWGLPGRFWRDLSEGLALLIEKKSEQAELLFSKWEDSGLLPSETRDLPLNYKMLGTNLLRRWADTVDLYQSLLEERNACQSENQEAMLSPGSGDRKKKKRGIAPSLRLLAARAYCELGDFESARQCIIDARLVEDNQSLEDLSSSLLPFFSLSGGIRETEQLLEVLALSKRSFPASTMAFWRGRCMMASGDLEGGSQELDRAHTLNPSPMFRERIAQVVKDERTLGSDGASSLQPLRDEIWAIFKQAVFVKELISPQRKSIAVLVFLIIIIVVFLLTDLPLLLSLVPGQREAMESLSNLIRGELFFRFALLPKATLEGDYYRLLSYMFLHTHITHVAFNIIGLSWFGRMSESIFGTSRFVSICLVGGILSGVAHVLLSDLPAVGASGAVMACFGAVGAGIFRLKNKLPPSIWRMQLSFLGGLAMAQLVLDQFIPHVAAYAHLGGLLSGLAIGALLSIRALGDNSLDCNRKYVSG